MDGYSTYVSTMFKRFLLMLNPFYKPPATDLMAKMVEDYERHLLDQENATAYHAKMAEYYRESLKRFKTQLAKV